MAPLRKVLMAGLVFAVFLMGSASPSAASCAPPLPLTEALASADLVIGTVTAARSAKRIATVAVEDIWRGNTDPIIEVAGGPEQPNAATSVDRTYDVGTRYLFVILEPARHPSSPGGNVPNAVRGQQLLQHAAIHVGSGRAAPGVRPSKSLSLRPRRRRRRRHRPPEPAHPRVEFPS